MEEFSQRLQRECVPVDVDLDLGLSVHSQPRGSREVHPRGPHVLRGQSAILGEVSWPPAGRWGHRGSSLSPVCCLHTLYPVLLCKSPSSQPRISRLDQGKDLLTSETQIESRHPLMEFFKGSPRLTSLAGPADEALHGPITT